VLSLPLCLLLLLVLLLLLLLFRRSVMLLNLLLCLQSHCGIVTRLAGQAGPLRLLLLQHLLLPLLVLLVL
jgi:hypothetical protein